MYLLLFKGNFTVCPLLHLGVQLVTSVFPLSLASLWKHCIIWVLFEQLVTFEPSQ